MSVVSYLRNTEKSKPGQQLLPEGVVKFLKTLNILFGTSDDHDKVDYDPTVALVNHIVECVGALRDVNRVYVGKGSVAAKSIGTRALFGLTSEMSSLMLGALLYLFMHVSCSTLSHVPLYIFYYNNCRYLYVDSNGIYFS